MKNILISKILFLLILSLTLNSQTINMVFSEKDDSKIFKIVERLIKAINKQANIKINLVSMPRKRAEIELLKNIYIHAVFARIIDFQENNLDLIRLQEPIIKIPLMIYTHKTLDFARPSLDNLKEYKIVYVRGTTFIEKYFKKHTQLYALTSEKQALRFLSVKRADIFISTPLLTDAILNSEEFKDSEIKAFSTPLVYVNTYSFFNKEYKNVAQKFNDALIILKKEGIYNDIIFGKK